MRLPRLIIATALASLGACTHAPAAGEPARAAAAEVRPGLEQLLDTLPAWAAGKRLGLITNHTGIDRRGRRTVDLLAARRDVRLTTLFAFEHGLRGDAPPGQPIAFTTDSASGLPVHSLYGEIDKPTPAMLADVDVLVYDVQDVGARPYTRVSTMALSMWAAAERGIPFVVLDRPNPIGGVEVEGPVLDTAYRSFVGMYPIPLRHGMTLGELARLYNERFGVGAELHVVPVRGWRRPLRFDATGLPWVPTSPNIRRLQAALLYPGTVLLEGTNLSEGRGTDAPFEQAGAPWLRAADVARELNARRLPGVRAEAISMAVAADGRKYGGQTLPAVRLVITDPDALRPVRTALHLLDVVRRLHPGDFAWLGANAREPRLLTIDRLAGSDRVRRAIDGGTLDALLVQSEREAAAFRALREPYLLYR
jgi:uncharacterized protein YbbC (DUF1343 family)